MCKKCTCHSWRFHILPSETKRSMRFSIVLQAFLRLRNTRQKNTLTSFKCRMRCFLTSQRCGLLASTCPLSEVPASSRPECSPVLLVAESTTGAYILHNGLPTGVQWFGPMLGHRDMCEHVHACMHVTWDACRKTCLSACISCKNALPIAVRPAGPAEAQAAPKPGMVSIST
jgi:hypothetical protein